jgi:hypothetical protein
MRLPKKRPRDACGARSWMTYAQIVHGTSTSRFTCALKAGHLGVHRDSADGLKVDWTDNGGWHMRFADPRGTLRKGSRR